MWSLATLLVGSAGLVGAVHTLVDPPAPKLRSLLDKHFVHAASGPLPLRAERAKQAPKQHNVFDLMGNLKKIPCNAPGELNKGKEFRQLVRDENGAALFEDEPLEPVHIFYRFHGQSAHDFQQNNTPALGVTSLVNTLQSATRALRSSTNLYMVVNGPMALMHKAWLHKVMDGLNLESLQLLEAPEGAQESYNFMVREMGKVKDVPNAIIMMMEEDYLVHPDMLTRLVEFWSLYRPCSVVPYEDPDYYLHRQKRNPRFRHHNTVLRTPGLFWRTVGWSTGTVALRLDLFHELHSKFLLPVGKSDAKSWVKWVRQFGIWAPMPVLASQMHMDTFHSKHHDQSFDPDFDYMSYMKRLQAQATELGYFETEKLAA